MSCDSMTLSTGPINGTCVLLKQKLDREMLIFTCHHHTYELVLKGIFEEKIKQVTTSSEVSPSKKFRDYWKNVDPLKIECFRQKIELCLLPKFEIRLNFSELNLSE